MQFFKSFLIFLFILVLLPFLKAETLNSSTPIYMPSTQIINMQVQITQLQDQINTLQNAYNTTSQTIINNNDKNAQNLYYSFNGFLANISLMFLMQDVILLIGFAIVLFLFFKTDFFVKTKIVQIPSNPKIEETKKIEEIKKENVV
jgi:predicted PurR-regulated permease PerM